MQKLYLLVGVLYTLGIVDGQKTTTTVSPSTVTNISGIPEKIVGSNLEKTRPAVIKPKSNGRYYYIKGKYAEIPIVNKKYPLASTYAPGENPEAKAAFLQLLAAMQAKGFAISTTYSGFRSYETQASLYQSYVNRDGQTNADRYSARPGYSEHQTGLAFDILDSHGNLLEEPTAMVSGKRSPVRICCSLYSRKRSYYRLYGRNLAHPLHRSRSNRYLQFWLDARRILRSPRW